MSTQAPRRVRTGKRQDVMTAALNEFQEHGFLETSMDRIAEVAHVSKRTVYNHFASKEALFEAILDELIVRCGHLEFPPLNDGPLEDQLLVIGQMYAEMVTSDDFIKLSRVVLSRFIQSPRMAGTAVTGREPQKPIQNWIETAQKQGRLPEFDAAQATTQFAGMITSTEYWPRLIQNETAFDESGRDQYLKSIVSMFLGYYAHLGTPGSPA